jgi:transcriptional regulator NrdR family protein
VNGVRCEQCGSSVVEIRMTVAGGATVRMRSCARCDRRFWVADGEPVELGDLLEQISPTR